MEINIENYLSQGEMAEIVKEEFRDYARSVIKKEQTFERLLVNLSYEFVFKMVDEAIDGDLASILRKKVSKQITDSELHYQIFRKKDIFERDESVAVKLIDSEVAKHTDLIKQKVVESIEKYPYHKLYEDDIYACIQDAIVNKIMCVDLFNKGSK